MKRTVKAKLEFTTTELNAILTRHIQLTYKVKIEEMEIKEGIISLYGEETTDIAKLNNGVECQILENILPGLQSKDKKPRVLKNKGISTAIREEFKEGHKIPLDVLLKKLNTSGFELYRSNLRNLLTNGTLGSEFTEVNPDVFQLTKFFKPNKAEIVH